MVFGAGHAGIEPDDTYVYTFGLSKGGLTGTPAIRSAGTRERHTVPLSSMPGSQNRCHDREHVVMLSDWTDGLTAC